MTSWVLHVDLDQFLAAVEVLRRPELAGLPIIVGGRGDPTERAVVSTASYEARAYGIRSGMPLKVAVRKCPEAVLLPVDFEACNAASDAVMTVLRAQPGAVVELLGWDEAFVGVPTSDPRSYAASLQRAVLSQTGLHCSVGIGDTKVRAKIATDFGKPQGIYELTQANWFEVMGERPTNAIWGIGTRISARLESLGARTVSELAELDPERLVGEFGPRMGPHFGNLGRGVSSATVDDTPWVARAHGHEKTYQTNLVGREAIADALRALADEVIADLRREQRACARVGLKVRFAPFFTVNRIRKLPEPTFSPSVIAEVAMALFDKLDDDRPVRLLGIRGEMVPPAGGYDAPHTTG